MYEEKNSFSLRTLILQLLTVLLFVFIMIWLFPTKNYMENNYVTEDELIQRLESIYGRLFADNVDTMRTAGKSYFTTERVPKKVGDSVTLTLGEMIEKKLVLAFVDSNGNSCDLNQSYVKMTRLNTEFELKVQLTCTDYQDYIIEYIGCYDFCGDCGILEEIPTVTIPTVNPKPTVTKKYKYQYILKTEDTYSNWSDWSKWSTTEVKGNLLTEVETKTEEVIVDYDQEYEIIGYKTENYTEYETETYIDYETKTETVATGTETVLADSINPTYTKGYYTSWKDASPVTTKNETLSSTDTKKYTLQSTNVYLDCNDSCSYITEYYYTVQTRKWVSGTPSCPTGYKLEGTKCNKYEQQTVYEEVTKQVPVEKTREVAVTKTREVPVYGYVDGEANYKTVTYYRYRTRTQLTVASEDIKWSESKNDTTLLNKKYVLTGKVEEM